MEGSGLANCTDNRTIWDNDPYKKWVFTRGLDGSGHCRNICVVLQSPSDQSCYCHVQRYTVICDYNRRIPSPFNLIPRLVQLIFLLKRDRSCDIKIGHTEIDLMNTKEKRKKSALQKNFQKIISFRSYNTK